MSAGDCRRCNGTGAAPSAVSIAALAGAVCPCGDCNGTGRLELLEPGDRQAPTIPETIAERLEAAQERRLEILEALTDNAAA